LGLVKKGGGVVNRDRVEQLYNEGKYQEAWWAYTALTARGGVPADVHLLGVQAAFRLGHLHSALYAIDQASVVASGNDAGKVRFARAGCLITLGRYDEATAELGRWIADLAQYPSLEPAYLGLAYYNLGVVSRQRERYAESMKYYATACDHLRKHNRHADLRMALQNMAWVACLSGDEATALDTLDQAEPLCESKGAHWHQQIGRAFLQAVSSNGDLHRVMTVCQAIIEHDGDDLPLSVRSHAYWLSGRVAMELGLSETARVMSEQALWFAAAEGDDRCLSDAARLINEIDHRFASVS
jgi:tetratricopeptide (TPR) repeat protein